ncbi:MAG: hypothetical protein JSU68_03445 [Phycisphaerales bacterium]|nr:MAG: hypothetical protein JSU68_03445 [Phycisphaerales bacterium]
MLARIGFMTSLLVVLVLTPACNEPETTGAREPAAKSGGEPQYDIGWSQIRRDMPAADVLDYLGHPRDIRVDRVSTFWFYSDRGVGGPHVCFTTRTNQVLTWRPPESK